MHQGVRLLLALHCLLCPAASISRQELFPFGGHWGDQLLPQGDDETSEGVKLSKVLPFYEAEFGSLYVGTNGLISTQDFPRETQYVDDGFPTDFPAIAPFLSDIDTSQGKGKIFYRQDTTEGILGRVAQEVRRGFPQAAFHPTNVFLATWENVGAYEEVTQLSGPSNRFNTFQAVIAYDDADAYAIFLYPKDGIQFFGTRPKESYNVHLDLPARVGFCRGESDFLKREGPFYSVTSSEQSVKDLYQKSNVHIPGVWVFHIGSISRMHNVVPAGVVGKPFLQQQVLMPETVVNNEGDEVYSDLGNENPNYPETFLYEEEELDYPLAGPTDRPPRLHAPQPDHVDQYESKQGYSSLQQHNEAKQPTFVEPHSNPEFSEVLRRGDTPQVERGDLFTEDDEEYNEPAVRDYVLATASANLPPYNENNPSYPDGAAAPSDFEVIPVHSEEETVLPPSSHGRPAADDDFHVRVESDVFTYRGARKDTCEGSQGQCSQHAYCRDYTYGFCCHCQSEYYGNGRYCLPKGAPHRVNGKVTGRILVDGSMVEFADVDLHAYIVLNDGRAYTAISHIPTLAARALMPLSPIGGLFGWLFALEKPGYENGFSVVGAKFTHNIDVTFYPGEERVHVTQVANGLDAHNYLNVKTTIKGQLPFMPEDSTIQMEPYSELYHYSGSAITSTTRREYSVVSGNGESVKYFYRLHQNVTYEDCAHDERVPPTTQKLNVDRVFVFYSKEERVLRYAMTNHIGSVQDPTTTDPTQVNPCYGRTHECHFTAQCQPGAGLDYSCECSTGFQGNGRDCTDVDECATGIHRCGPFSVCHNLPGRYRCECQDGYQLQSDGYTCAPVSSGSNPCEDGRHNCAPSNIAQCISHAVGTFRCVCLPGFSGDGRNCTDIDECAQGRCHANAVCYNSPGSFTCRCRPGYEGDGFQCALRPGPIKTLCQQQREELEASFAPRGPRPIVGVNLPQCDSAGEFIPQQCHSSTGECWCVDKGGREISGTRSRPGTTPRNCDIPAPTHRPQTVCERWRQSLLEHYGGTPTAEHYIPQCDAYGNFSPLQCHGNSGYCWCVDKDGREVPGTRKEPGMTPACIPTVAPPTMRPTPRTDVTPPAEGMFLLYAQGQQIGVLPLNGTKLNKATAKTLLSLHGSIVVGIDYDCKARMVYWTDVAGRTISRAKIEAGAEPEIIVNTGLLSPEGIAIDYHRRAMFWTDSGLDRIETASLDGSERKVLFDTDLVNPRAITVDSVRGNLYWTDWNREAPKIETSYVDGSNRRILVNEDIGLPNGLTYDPFSKQICWGDAGTKKLECMHPNGTGRRVVQSNLNYPFSVVCYANHIYLTDWRRDGVISVNKDSGAITEEYLPEQRSHLYGITAVHRYCPSGRK